MIVTTAGTVTENADTPAHQVQWTWADSLHERSELLNGLFKPQEVPEADYRGLKTQPAAFPGKDWDHILIPDLDLSTEDREALVVVAKTGHLETRHSKPIEPLNSLLSGDSRDFYATQKTTAGALSRVLRIPIQQLVDELGRQEDKIHRVEKWVSSEKKILVDRHDLEGATFEIRRDLARLRRLLISYQQVVLTLFEPSSGAYQEAAPGVESERRQHFTFLRELIERSLAKERWSRELLESIGSWQVQKREERLNHLLLILTTLSVVFLPIAVFAGAFGMNVDFPLRETREGFWAAVLLMAVSTAVLVALVSRYRKRLHDPAG